jgi:hypothetical protein
LFPIDTYPFKEITGAVTVKLYPLKVCAELKLVPAVTDPLRVAPPEDTNEPPVIVFVALIVLEAPIVDEVTLLHVNNPEILIFPFWYNVI